jgi:hypothetical protein
MSIGFYQAERTSMPDISYWEDRMSVGRIWVPKCSNQWPLRSTGALVSISWISAWELRFWRFVLWLLRHWPRAMREDVWSESSFVNDLHLIGIPQISKIVVLCLLEFSCFFSQFPWFLVEILISWSIAYPFEVVLSPVSPLAQLERRWKVACATTRHSWEIPPTSLNAQIFGQQLLQMIFLSALHNWLVVCNIFYFP